MSIKQATFTLDVSREPRISGYGGFDQWTLTMTSQQADDFFDELQQLVEKHGGDFTGAN